MRGPFIALKGPSFGLMAPLWPKMPYNGLKGPCGAIKGPSFGLKRSPFVPIGHSVGLRGPLATQMGPLSGSVGPELS